MNNRFKFRAYSKELRKMYEVDTICPYEDNHTKGGEVSLKGIQYNSFYFPEEVEVMQCTGLKDKNGKLIYEGDVVNGSCGVYWGKMVVEYNVARFVLNKKGKQLDFLEEDNFVEVIGNIYENKSLLESEG